MLQELTLTPATIVIGLLIIGWTVWAIRRLTRRGMCDCSGKCDGRSTKCGKTGSPAGCAHCSAADDMVARLDASLRKEVPSRWHG